MQETQETQFRSWVRNILWSKVGYSPGGRKELGMIERVHVHARTHTQSFIESTLRLAIFVAVSAVSPTKVEYVHIFAFLESISF